MPIVLATGPYSRNAKVAKGLANQTWHPIKKTYYYGVKLHVIGYARQNKLPIPEQWFITPAATHDLQALKSYAEEMQSGELVGDRAYVDQTFKEELFDRGIELRTPAKRKPKVKKLYWKHQRESRTISKIRQPIEALFAWIQKLTQMQNTAKVRSQKGLIVHIWGRMAAVTLMLAQKI